MAFVPLVGGRLLSSVGLLGYPRVCRDLAARRGAFVKHDRAAIAAPMHNHVGTLITCPVYDRSSCSCREPGHPAAVRYDSRASCRVSRQSGLAGLRLRCPEGGLNKRPDPSGEGVLVGWRGGRSAGQDGMRAYGFNPSVIGCARVLLFLSLLGDPEQGLGLAIAVPPVPTGTRIELATRWSKTTDLYWDYAPRVITWEVCC
jgi:hypothetical protein